MAAVVPLCGEGFSSGSSQSSIGDKGHRLIQHRELDGQYRKHFGELMSTHGRAGIHTESTLEFFIDRPTEPTFSQEKNNLHAKEVSVRGGTCKVSVRQTCPTCWFSLRSIYLLPKLIQTDAVR